MTTKVRNSTWLPNVVGESDIAAEAQFKSDCEKITEAIRPLENVQVTITVKNEL